jgi:hypothetical protein
MAEDLEESGDLEDLGDGETVPKRGRLGRVEERETGKADVRS